MLKWIVLAGVAFLVVGCSNEDKLLLPYKSHDLRPAVKLPWPIHSGMKEEAIERIVGKCNLKWSESRFYRTRDYTCVYANWKLTIAYDRDHRATDISFCQDGGEWVTLYAVSFRP
jgi:hypothetical protein